MTQEQAKANSLIKYVSCLAAACLLMMPRIVSAQEVEHNALTDDFERDRLAILAMAGEYEVSFSFEETVALQAGYLVHEPHRSRGRELVWVIEDRGDFVSLQHLLVIDTTESGDAPISMRDEWDDRDVKHWRQDWTYQDTALLAYAGFQSWEHQALSSALVSGTWTQAVYQVNDLPRSSHSGAGCTLPIVPPGSRV
jgi:hypothetical protein